MDDGEMAMNDAADSTVKPARTREQVVAQLRVAAHLAKQIVTIHEQKADFYAQINMDDGLIDVVGHDSAAVMEILGNVLNNMDAVDDHEDGWTAPIFAVAQATWPAAGL